MSCADKQTKSVTERWMVKKKDRHSSDARGERGHFWIEHYNTALQQMSAMDHYVSSMHAVFACLVVPLMHWCAVISPGIQQC